MFLLLRCGVPLVSEPTWWRRRTEALERVLGTEVESQLHADVAYVQSLASVRG